MLALHTHTARALFARPNLLRRAVPSNVRTMVHGSALVDTDKSGAFKRQESQFRNQVAPGTRFEPEAGRYHLYISYACPWAARTLTALYLKGLEDVIGLSVVHPTWQRTRPDDPQDPHAGWVFRDPSDPPLSSQTGHGSFDCKDCVPDTVNSAKSIRDLYEKAGASKGARYTVPVLWDKKEGTIVNNESSEVLRILNSAFNDFAKNPGLDLYPEALRSTIDEVNAWVYDKINNGVYKCGFAQKQEPYEEAHRELYAALNRCEEILSRQRYIAGGSHPTEADVRLYQTLIRFDPVYVVYFKTDGHYIRDFPNLSNYVRELYSIDAFRKATNITHIKRHYFTSHPTLNAYAIIPVGGDHWWEEKHNRDSIPAAAAEPAGSK